MVSTSPIISAMQTVLGRVSFRCTDPLPSPLLGDLLPTPTKPDRVLEGNPQFLVMPGMLMASAGEPNRNG